MLPLCKLVTKSLQFSIFWNDGFLLSLSVFQSRIVMLSFSNSILCSGFLPTPGVQMMLWLCQWFICIFWTVFSLLFELYDFSVWKHSGILSRPLHTIFVNAHPYHFSFLPGCHSQYMHIFPRYWYWHWHSSRLPECQDLPCIILGMEFTNAFSKEIFGWHATHYFASVVLLSSTFYLDGILHVPWGRPPDKGCWPACFPTQWCCRGQNWDEAFQCSAP